MAIEGQRLPVLVTGRIESLQDGIIALQCTLLATEDGELLGIVGGMARLCGSELAMQGGSGLVHPVNTAEASVRPQLAPAQIETSAPHPLADPAFPYRVRLLVKSADGQPVERPGTFRGNDYFVPLRPGEVFQIYYTNRSAKPVFARVLVDGLNTLPERSRCKGAYVEPVVGSEYLPAQPVNLAEARAWGPLEPNKEYAVAGFYSETGDRAVFDEFKVVDADQSLASQAGYTDQLGLITVAFYEQAKKAPKPQGGRNLGVGLGDRYQTQTDVYTGDYEPGRLLAVINIRYGQ